MGVTAIQMDQAGLIPNTTGLGKNLAQQLPTPIYIETSDTLATVLVPGYLTHAKTYFQFPFNNQQMALVYTTDQGTVWLSVVVGGTAPNYTYSLAGTTSVVTIVEAALGSAAAPSITFAARTDVGLYSPSAHTLGVAAAGLQLASWSTAGLTLLDGSFVVNAGDISALNGTFVSGSAAGASQAGQYKAYSATTAQGSLTLKCTGNTGFDAAIIVTNANFGQSTTLTIPDPGVAATKFLLTDSAGTQTIATGSLALTVGSITATAGNLQAGSSGHAGTVTSFPGTAANGKLVLAAVNNAGNFFTTISSAATLGQTEVITIPDAGAATGSFLVGATLTPFTSNHSLVASGTAGLVADAGYQMKVVAQAAVAGGAAAQTVTDAFCTSASMVVCTWNDTTNAVSIQKAVAGNGSFVVTSSGDPGASHINYIITKV